MKTQPQPQPTIKALLDEHVTLTVECLDRLYLNGYIGRISDLSGGMVLGNDRSGDWGVGEWWLVS